MSNTRVVFVVDSDGALRQTIERLVSRQGMQAKSFASAEAFLACPRAPVPSCVVLDLSPPDLNGLEVQRRIAGQPELPIIFVTGFKDVLMAVRAMKAGAIEVLTKPLVEETLLDAVRFGLDISRSLLARNAESEAMRGRYRSLTRRQREVMELVVAGMLNKQAAKQLGISEVTVKAHRGRVMRKMHAGSLPDLVRMSANLAIARPELAVETSTFPQLNCPVEAAAGGWPQQRDRESGNPRKIG